MFITLFRIANLILLGSGLVKSLSTKLPPHIVKAGHFQFITNCSLLTTILYLISSFFYTSPWFYNLACNLEFNVIFSYWTMALFFKSMVAEDEVDRNLFMDLQVHFFPYIYLIIDNQPTLNLKNSWISTATFIFLYWVYIEWECGKHIHDGISGFPYPFMKGLNKIQRFGCMAVFATIACFNYFVLSLRNKI